MAEVLTVLLLTSGLFLLAAQLVLKRLNVHLAFVFVTFAVLPALCLSLSDRYQSIADDYTRLPLFMAAYMAGLSVPLAAVSFGSRFDFAAFERDGRVGPVAILLAFLVLLAHAAIGQHYGVFLSGAAREELVRAVPYAIVALLYVLQTISLACGVYMLAFCRSRPALLAFIALFAADALASGGRRELLLALVMAALLHYRTVFLQPSLKLLAIGCGCLAIFIAITPLFAYTRAHFLDLTYYFQQPAVVALPSAVQAAVESTFNGPHPYLDLVGAQVANRGNSGTFLLRIADSGRDPLGGAAIANSLLWTMPGFLVEKPFYAPEQMIQQAFSLRITDDASSALSLFYSDFGTFGLFLGGAAVGALLTGYLWIAHRAHSLFIRSLFLALFFKLSVGIEADFHGPLVDARNAALVAAAVLIAQKLWRGLDRRLTDLRGGGVGAGMRSLTGSAGSAARRAKIALVVPALDSCGGVGTVAEFLLRTLRRRPDLEIALISLAMSSRDPASLLLHRPSTWRRGVALHRGGFAGEPFTHVGAVLGEFEFQRLKSRPALDALIATCDVVQVVAGIPGWAWPVIGCGKPVALQVATLAHVERRRLLAGPATPIRLWRRLMTQVTAAYDRAALAAVDAVLVENPWMLAHARAAARPGAIVRLAAPGIDTTLFVPVEAPAVEEPYILSVGRFCDPRKNALGLLEAYALLSGTLGETRCPRLLLTGSAGPHPDFWKRADLLGLSEKVGLRTGLNKAELAELYRHALCFALPSDEEGFGMVVIESMACGIPVVATRCGGPEGIITDGLDGFLVERDDAKALAERLAALVTGADLRRVMGKAARRTVERRFAEEVAGGAFLEVYDHLLAERSGIRGTGGTAPLGAITGG